MLARNAARAGIALAVWLIGLGLIGARPVASLDEARGLYAAQGDQAAYRWTSNRVRIPIHGGSGPTSVALAIGQSRWPGRPAPTVTLASDQTILARFAAPDAPRRYHVLLAPSESLLSIETTVDKPPQGDRRWLGVTLYGLTARATGLPLRAAGYALALTLAAALLARAAVWGARCGYAIEIGLTLLALALRVAMLDRAPAGWRADEVVSLVDAWNISRTARDHLGHLLPLGAQEALGDWISPLLTYLELPLVAIFGPRRLIGRLTTAVAGALAAPLCYRLACALPASLRSGYAIAAPRIAGTRAGAAVSAAHSAGALVAGLVAALSPWQIFLSRNALPPALVPASWAACLLAALLWLRRGGRREALVLAAVAGVALYSYPTMKLAVPLLVALAAALALTRYGWRAGAVWAPAVPLAALLWLPFAYVTLFVPASSTRLDQTALQADTWGQWLAAWWDGYSVYFRPGFYYATGDGSPIRGVPGYGVELRATAPLVAVGLVALLRAIYALRADAHTNVRTRSAASAHPHIEWLLIAGALLIAPLPASLTQPSPHAYRAALLAPLYALLAGLGAAALWRLAARMPGARARRALQLAGTTAVAAAVVWQAGVWFRAYTQSYPPQRAWENQDGLSDAMVRAVARAVDVDEIWISYQDINEPYIYLLAARPMPPAEAQARIAVTRRPGHLNDITSIARYRFVAMDEVPRDLMALEAIPDRFGGPAFVLQQWQRDGKRILIVRRMD